MEPHPTLAPPPTTLPDNEGPLLVSDLTRQLLRVDSGERPLRKAKRAPAPSSQLPTLVQLQRATELKAKFDVSRWGIGLLSSTNGDNLLNTSTNQESIESRKRKTRKSAEVAELIDYRKFLGLSGDKSVNGKENLVASSTKRQDQKKNSAAKSLMSESQNPSTSQSIRQQKRTPLPQSTAGSKLTPRHRFSDSKNEIGRKPEVSAGDKSKPYDPEDVRKWMMMKKRKQKEKSNVQTSNSREAKSVEKSYDADAVKSFMEKKLKARMQSLSEQKRAEMEKRDKIRKSLEELDAYRQKERAETIARRKEECKLVNDASSFDNFRSDNTPRNVAHHQYDQTNDIQARAKIGETMSSDDADFDNDESSELDHPVLKALQGGPSNGDVSLDYYARRPEEMKQNEEAMDQSVQIDIPSILPDEQPQQHIPDQQQPPEQFIHRLNYLIQATELLNKRLVSAFENGLLKEKEVPVKSAQLVSNGVQTRQEQMSSSIQNGGGLINDLITKVSSPEPLSVVAIKTASPDLAEAVPAQAVNTMTTAFTTGTSQAPDQVDSFHISNVTPVIPKVSLKRHLINREGSNPDIRHQRRDKVDSIAVQTQKMVPDEEFKPDVIIGTLDFEDAEETDQYQKVESLAVEEEAEEEMVNSDANRSSAISPLTNASCEVQTPMLSPLPPPPASAIATTGGIFQSQLREHSAGSPISSTQGMSHIEPANRAHKPAIFREYADIIPLNKPSELIVHMMGLPKKEDDEWNVFKVLKRKMKDDYFTVGSQSMKSLKLQNLVDRNNEKILASRTEKQSRGTPVALGSLFENSQFPKAAVSPTQTRVNNELLKVDNDEVGVSDNSLEMQDVSTSVPSDSQSQSGVNTASQRSDPRMSPNTLSHRLWTEIQLLEALGQSQVQLSEFERAQDRIASEVDMQILSKVLKAKEDTYDKDLAKAKLDRETIAFNHQKASPILTKYEERPSQQYEDDFDSFTSLQQSFIEGNLDENDVPEDALVRNQTIDDYHSVTSIQEDIDKVSEYEKENCAIDDYTSVKDSRRDETITGNFESKALETIMQYLEKGGMDAKDSGLLLQLREQALEEQVKNELALLRQQRNDHKHEPKFVDSSRQLERALLLKYAAEKAEIQRQRLVNSNHLVPKRSEHSRASANVSPKPTSYADDFESPRATDSNTSISIVEEIPEDLSIAEEIEMLDQPDESLKRSDSPALAGDTSVLSESISSVRSSVGSLLEKLKKAKDNEDDLSRLERREKRLKMSRKIAESLLNKRATILDWEKRLREEEKAIKNLLDDVLMKNRQTRGVDRNNDSPLNRLEKEDDSNSETSDVDESSFQSAASTISESISVEAEDGEDSRSEATELENRLKVLREDIINRKRAVIERLKHHPAEQKEKDEVAQDLLPPSDLLPSSDTVALPETKHTVDAEDEKQSQSVKTVEKEYELEDDFESYVSQSATSIAEDIVEEMSFVEDEEEDKVEVLKTVTPPTAPAPLLPTEEPPVVEELKRQSPVSLPKPLDEEEKLDHISQIILDEEMDDAVRTVAGIQKKAWSKDIETLTSPPPSDLPSLPLSDNVTSATTPEAVLAPLPVEEKDPKLGFDVVDARVHTVFGETMAASATYETAPVIDKHMVDEFLNQIPSADEQVRALLLFDAFQEAVDSIFSQHKEYAHYIANPVGRKPVLKPTPISNTRAVEDATNLVHTWRDYSKNEGENLDLLLIQEVRDEEKIWKNLEKEELVVKEDICDAIFNDMILECIDCLDNVRPK